MTPARGKMPFPGHRTIAQIDAMSLAAKKRMESRKRALEYGFDPEALLPKALRG